MKRKGLSLAKKRELSGYLFIAPWLIGFLGFFIFNLMQTAVFSMNSLQTAEGGYTLTYVGWDNFRFALLESADFLRRLTESIGGMILDVPLIIFFSLFIAILLNRKFHGRAAIRAIFFLPVIMGSAAIVEALAANLQNVMGGVSSSTSQLAFDTTTTGVTSGFNSMILAETLLDFGVPEQIVGYLSGAVSRVYDIIRMSGVQIIIFLASLQSISPSLYEVAQIEGATAYETFWKVTFPMVSPLILTNVVYTIVDLFAQSDIVEAARDTAFKTLDFGVSSAMSLLSSLCVCLILGLISWLIGRKVFYQS